MQGMSRVVGRPGSGVRGPRGRRLLLTVLFPALSAVPGCAQTEADPVQAAGLEAFREALRDPDDAAGPPEPVGSPAPCRVTRIVDGDTIDCEPVGRIRLIGMDTPERGQRPYGPRATRVLRGMIPVGTPVEVERDVEPTDRYGRVLGYVWVSGELVNWWMVRTGYAVTLTYPPNVQYVERFRDAQAEARREGAGLWAVDGFACEPRAYRAGACGR